ncbi:hypothetical protein [Asaia spathodeae]|uniref:Alginate biosynthesis protein AlgF n=1 Tax=Asaia spathodeae TaxID=657016 RepID=A0ABX2P7L7_9PROT|nr:hypothetical protein [Asaia spathodeae]GBR12212.1 hypothetical protein AA105894_0452 [Asaia spathodeae NBRC 105894]
MKTSPFLFAACALAPFMASALAAPLFDPTGFELRETQPFSISVQPTATLASARNPAYHLVPGGITLSSAARKPTAYHARQPRTELSESHIWRVQDTPAAFSTALHIDQFPKSGQIVLAELGPDNDNAPLLRLMIDGDRVVLRGMIDNAPANGVAVGTIDATHQAHIALQTRADGQVTTLVNGTQSQLHLTRQALSIPVVFRTGAHVVEDIGTTPDTVTVTLTGLSASHGTVGSSLRT